MTGKLVKSLLCISTVALLLAGCGKSEEVGGAIPPQPVARERASSEAAAPAAEEKKEERPQECGRSFWYPTGCCVDQRLNR